MDFTEYGAERNIVDARDLPKDTQNYDESRRLLDEIRAIEAPERQMILRASARQLRPGAFYRGSGDAAPISKRQFSPPASPSSKQKLLVIITVVVGIAGGVVIGVIFSAANTVRLAPKVSEVTRSFARLVGGGADSVAVGTTPTAAPAAIAEQIPATHSAQIFNAPGSSGAPLDQVPAPAQTTSSNVAPALSEELAQPAAATAEYEKMGQSGEGDLPIDRNVPVVVNAQSNASPPLAEGQEDDSVLFREFLEWRSNQVKPQAQQQRPLHSSKHVTRPHVLGSHPTNVHSSSRTNDLGRHGPPGSKDSERRS